MHELGIVFHLIKQIEDVAKENRIEKVTEVTLEVGEVSTIEPKYFKECYEWAKKRSEYMNECKLNMVIVEAISFCRKCEQTYSTTKYAKICPHCGSDDTYLVSGDQVIIKNIQVV